MTTTRMFTEAELDEFDIGPWSAVAMIPGDKHRWYTVTAMVFELDGQHWQVTYLDPATENQDGQDRYADRNRIEGTLVHLAPVTVDQWQPVPDDSPGGAPADQPTGPADAPTALDEIVHDVAKALGVTPAEVDTAAARYAPAVARVLKDAVVPLPQGYVRQGELPEIPNGWGYLDCIARAIHLAPPGSTPRAAADLVAAELRKQGYTFGDEPAPDADPLVSQLLGHFADEFHGLDDAGYWPFGENARIGRPPGHLDRLTIAHQTDPAGPAVEITVRRVQ